MSAAAVIALVVAAGEGQVPTTGALIAAAQEALGGGTAIRVFEAAPPTDEAALEVETEIDALGVVTLIWQSPQRLQAAVRVHVARTDRWTSRDITFAAVDTPFERGRALGFAVASMLPDEVKARAARATEVTPPPQQQPAEPQRLNAIGLFGVGAAGDGSGVGGTLGGTRLVAESLELRAALSARNGSVAGLQNASLLVASVAAGVAWWPVAPVAGHPVGAGLRADLALLRREVFFKGDSYGSFLPAADLLGQVAVRIAADLEVRIAVGGELAIGRTPVLVDTFMGSAATETSNQIPRLAPVGEVGVQYRF
jgi:hypothetical protein